jgi:DNA-binding Xre family transcriptional regulator
MVMPMKNRVKEFLSERGLSAYQFIKETGIAPATGYKLAKKSTHLPSITVLQAICDRYEVQPTAVIYWTGEKDEAYNENP